MIITLSLFTSKIPKWPAPWAPLLTSSINDLHINPMIQIVLMLIRTLTNHLHNIFYPSTRNIGNELKQFELLLLIRKIIQILMLIKHFQHLQWKLFHTSIMMNRILFSLLYRASIYLRTYSRSSWKLFHSLRLTTMTEIAHGDFIELRARLRSVCRVAEKTQRRRERECWWLLMLYRAITSSPNKRPQQERREN